MAKEHAHNAASRKPRSKAGQKVVASPISNGLTNHDEGKFSQLGERFILQISLENLE